MLSVLVLLCKSGETIKEEAEVCFRSDATSECPEGISQTMIFNDVENLKNAIIASTDTKFIVNVRTSKASPLIFNLGNTYSNKIEFKGTSYKNTFMCLKNIDLASICLTDIHCEIISNDSSTPAKLYNISVNNASVVASTIEAELVSFENPILDIKEIDISDSFKMSGHCTLMSDITIKGTNTDITPEVSFDDQKVKLTCGSTLSVLFEDGKTMKIDLMYDNLHKSECAIELHKESTITTERITTYWLRMVYIIHCYAEVTYVSATNVSLPFIQLCLFDTTVSSTGQYGPMAIYSLEGTCKYSNKADALFMEFLGVYCGSELTIEGSSSSTNEAYINTFDDEGDGRLISSRKMVIAHMFTIENAFYTDYVLYSGNYNPFTFDVDEIVVTSGISIYFNEQIFRNLTLLKDVTIYYHYSLIIAAGDVQPITVKGNFAYDQLTIRFGHNIVENYYYYKKFDEIILNHEYSTAIINSKQINMSKVNFEIDETAEYWVKMCYFEYHNNTVLNVDYKCLPSDLVQKYCFVPASGTPLEACEDANIIYDDVKDYNISAHMSSFTIKVDIIAQPGSSATATLLSNKNVTLTITSSSNNFVIKTENEFVFNTITISGNFSFSAPSNSINIISNKFWATQCNYCSPQVSMNLRNTKKIVLDCQIFKYCIYNEVPNVYIFIGFEYEPISKVIYRNDGWDIVLKSDLSKHFVKSNNHSDFEIYSDDGFYISPLLQGPIEIELEKGCTNPIPIKYSSIYYFKFLEGTGQVQYPIVTEAERKTVIDSDDDFIPVNFTTPISLSTRMLSLLSKNQKTIKTPITVENHTIITNSNQTLTMNDVTVKGSRSGIVGNSLFKVGTLIVDENAVSSFRSVEINSMDVMPNSTTFIDNEANITLITVNIEKGKNIPLVEFGSDLNNSYMIKITSSTADAINELNEYKTIANINPQSNASFNLVSSTTIDGKEVKYSIKKEGNSIKVMKYNNEDPQTDTSFSSTTNAPQIGDDGKDKSDGKTVGIAVSVTLVCVLVIAAVIGVILFIRKKKNEYESDDLSREIVV